LDEQEFDRKLVSSEIRRISDEEFLRIKCTHEVGMTFFAIRDFEQTLIQAIWASEANFVPANEQLDRLQKLKTLTTGNLLKALNAMGTEEKDRNYLLWAKKKRDYFIHNFLLEYPWPNEIDAGGNIHIIRTLRAWQIIFRRATSRIWDILQRANHVHIQDLGEDGRLITHREFYNSFGNEEPEV